MRRRALDHRYVGAVLPEIGADVVRRVVRADDDALLARVGFAAGVLARMMLDALECGGTGKLDVVRHPGHSGRQDQLLWAQRQGLAAALDDDLPFLALLVV